MTRLAWWAPLCFALVSQDYLADAFDFHWLPRTADVLLGWGGLAASLSIATALEFRLAGQQRRYRCGARGAPLLATAEVPDLAQVALAAQVAGIARRQDLIFATLEEICAEAGIPADGHESPLEVVRGGTL